MPMKINPPTKINNKIIQTSTLSLDSRKNKEKKDFVKQANGHNPLGKTIIEKTNIENERQYPWNNPIVRDDVIKIFNLRLTEPDWLKLKYIADNTKESMHAVCLDILIPAIHRRLKKIIEK